jgi:hypothetical protein
MLVQRNLFHLISLEKSGVCDITTKCHASKVDQEHYMFESLFV